MSDRVGWTVVCRCGVWQFMEVEEWDMDPRCDKCGNHLMRYRREHEAAPEISEAAVERAAKAICDEWGYLWDAPPEDDQSTGTGEWLDERPTKDLYRKAARAALEAARNDA